MSTTTIQLGVWLSVGDQPPVHVGTAEVEAKTTASADGITIEAGAAIRDALHQAADALTAPVYGAREHVSITIDGETVSFPSGEHDTIYVLTAAGLTAPWKYDLIRLDQDGRHVVTHQARDTIVIADGDDFITAPISTTAA